MLPIGAAAAAGARWWFQDDVDFDRDDAEEAVAALRAARAALDDLADGRVRAARVAREEWRGAHRHDFDRELERTQSTVTAGIDRIDATIRHILAAVDDAERDQARRLRRRDEHLADLARQHLLP